MKTTLQTRNIFISTLTVFLLVLKDCCKEWEIRISKSFIVRGSFPHKVRLVWIPLIESFKSYFGNWNLYFLQLSFFGYLICLMIQHIEVKQVFGRSIVYAVATFLTEEIGGIHLYCWIDMFKNPILMFSPFQIINLCSLFYKLFALQKAPPCANVNNFLVGVIMHHLRFKSCRCMFRYDLI